MNCIKFEIKLCDTSRTTTKSHDEYMYCIIKMIILL